MLYFIMVPLTCQSELEMIRQRGIGVTLSDRRKYC